MKKFTDYTKVSDVYACGITLYRLVNGDTYLPSIDLAEATRRARKGEFPPREKYRDFIPKSLRKLINKALSVDPSERFQSADEMRHALERQKLLVAWEEIRTRGGRIWKGVSVSDRRFRVSVSMHENGKWDIEFKTGAEGKLRRKNADCHQGLTKAKAEQLTKRILQRVTQTDA